MRSSLRCLDWRFHHVEVAESRAGETIIRTANRQSHMLSRFNHDVVRLHPRVVVILGGINDIERIPLPQIEQNLASMAETAEQHGIYVVLATLLPTGEQDADKPSAAHIAGRDDSVSGHNRIMFGHDQSKH